MCMTIQPCHPFVPKIRSTRMHACTLHALMHVEVLRTLECSTLPLTPLILRKHVYHLSYLLPPIAQDKADHQTANSRPSASNSNQHRHTMSVVSANTSSGSGTTARRSVPDWMVRREDMVWHWGTSRLPYLLDTTEAF